jgi:hypothetical protein
MDGGIQQQLSDLLSGLLVSGHGAIIETKSASRGTAIPRSGKPKEGGSQCRFYSTKQILSKCKHNTFP